LTIARIAYCQKHKEEKAAPKEISNFISSKLKSISTQGSKKVTVSDSKDSSTYDLLSRNISESSFNVSSAKEMKYFSVRGQEERAVSYSEEKVTSVRSSMKH
jgi:hypothetical protein